MLLTLKWHKMSNADLRNFVTAITSCEQALADATNKNWQYHKINYQQISDIVNTASVAMSEMSSRFAYRIHLTILYRVRRWFRLVPHGRCRVGDVPVSGTAFIPQTTFVQMVDVLRRSATMFRAENEPALSELVDARIDATDCLVAIHEFTR